MSEESDVEAIAALLEDEIVRTILAETSVEPMSASTLSERCGASQPTVYRRLDDLRERDLLVERTRPDPTGGHHHTVYSTNFRRVTVDLDDGSFSLHVDRQEDIVDRFTALIEGM
ncbi:winged helix-turn-helix domain-containing protein [Halococcus agarilyticus]|uniref:winged helix-turn-helix domain-containing protein n=1 Tax=Halococcus agarilyticus TaxID=1232219 RepID=UPI00067820AF|nr:winged helix-turn-helix domain-containing protein [Halococcus agarilyticus]